LEAELKKIRPQKIRDLTGLSIKDLSIATETTRDNIYKAFKGENRTLCAIFHRALNEGWSKEKLIEEIKGRKN
jgi:hypothetical protein